MAEHGNGLTGKGSIASDSSGLGIVRWLIAVALITAPATGAIGATQAMQEYKGLALAPDGMRLAVVEPVAETVGAAHGGCAD